MATIIDKSPAINTAFEAAWVTGKFSVHREAPTTNNAVPDSTHSGSFLGLALTRLRLGPMNRAKVKKLDASPRDAKAFEKPKDASG